MYRRPGAVAGVRSWLACLQEFTRPDCTGTADGDVIEWFSPPEILYVLGHRRRRLDCSIKLVALWFCQARQAAAAAAEIKILDPGGAR